MKILIVSQRFYPENFRINDIALELKRRGHDITVLTGLPNYPEGTIYSGYEKAHKKTSEDYQGIKIIRAKEIGRRNNMIFRFLNYYSFPFYANRKVRHLDKDFDVVLVNQLSPIMMAYPAIKYKKHNNCKLIMYEMDLWPESLLAGGVGSKSLLYRYYKNVSRRIYSKMDKILTTSQGHVEYIKSLTGLDNVSYLPQYSEDIYGKLESNLTRGSRFIFSFTGNIGKAQNLETLIKSCELLKRNNINDFLIYIVGEGTEKDCLNRLVKESGLDNIVFTGKKTLDEVIAYYALSHVMIISLEDKSYARLTVPGKLQGYMYAGKPILSFASGETNNIVIEANCGLISESNDVEKLAENLKRFINMSEEELISMGKNAKKYYERHFNRQAFFERLEKDLKSLAKN